MLLLILWIIIIYYIYFLYRYGSLETCNLHSNITIIPKRPLTENHTLVSSLTLNTCSSLNVIQDRCYEIHNTDLVRISKQYKIVLLQAYTY